LLAFILASCVCWEASAVIDGASSRSSSLRFVDARRFITDPEKDVERYRGTAGSRYSPARDFEYPGWASKCRQTRAFAGELLLSCVPLTSCRFVARFFERAYYDRPDRGMQAFLDELVCGKGPGNTATTSPVWFLSYQS
jgi:hypothetical protein